MNKVLISLFLFLTVSANILAQEYNIAGKVTDKKTNKGITTAGVRLMKSDSSFVNGAVASADGNFNFKVKEKGKYILKISSIGYLDKYINITFAKKTTADLGNIPLSENDILLKEATITSHAAKVQTKEDTLVYNASAYRTPDGSTLEALVEKLPGAEVEDDGTIKINGKTVSQLLIDGKDFFKGDTKIAMKNLPVDMVNNIKSYEKQSDYTKQTGIDDGNEETVLDVGLKKKLKSSWISNIDLAAGNKNRYSNRAFVSRFNDNSRIAAFGSINNVNDRGFSRFGGRGSGLTATRNAGISGFWHNDMKEDSARYFEIGGQLRFSTSSSDNLSRSNSETFLSSGSSFANSSSHSFGKSTSVTSSLQLKWNPDSVTFFEFRPKYSHSSSDRSSSSLTATFNADPYNIGISPLDSVFMDTDPLVISQQFKDITVNRNNRSSLSDSKSDNFGGEFNLTRRLNKKGRSITLSGEAEYTTSSSHSYSISDIYYYQRDSDPQSFNNQYTNAPSKAWSYKGEISYSEPLWKNWFLQGSYEYKYKYSDRERNLYQLDSLTDWGIGNLHPIGSLPDGDLLHTVQNMENSQYATYKDHIHEANIGIRYSTKELNFHAGVRLQPQNTQLSYKKAALDTTITRNVFNIAPDLRLRYRIDKFTRLDFRYRGSSSQPSMTDLLDVTDNSDPLNISSGNPGLKPSWTNRMELNFNSFSEKKQSSIFSSINFEQTSNNISNAVIYDPTTGVRTTRPENINGDWQIRSFVGYNMGFGKEKAFTFETATFFSYANNVGFISLNNSNSQKNTVTTLRLNESLGLTYRWDLFEFGVTGRVNYQKSKSELQSRSNMEVFRFDYGPNLQYTTPWKTSISSSLLMNSRRGYSDESMNTNELIWNVQLSQTMLKNALTLSVQAYDLLHQQSNVSRIINAQMRQDSWNNSINSYFMVHLIYRLNIFNGKAAKREDGRRGPEGPGMGGPRGGTRPMRSR